VFAAASISAFRPTAVVQCSKTDDRFTPTAAVRRAKETSAIRFEADLSSADPAERSTEIQASRNPTQCGLRSFLSVPDMFRWPNR
jgi:hypothetical protein